MSPELDSDRAIDLDLDAEIELGPDLVIDLTVPLRHRPVVTESGSFTRASCRACGWSGPARRARAVADADARRHEAGD